MRFALGGVQGNDNVVELVPGRATAPAEGRIVVAREIESELAAHLSLPLLDQRRRHQDERRPRQSAQVQLIQNKARFNSLPQTHLVAQQGASAKAAQHGLGRADLVLEQFHVAHQRQADEAVKSCMRCQARRPQGQIEFRQRRRSEPAHDHPVLGIEGDAHPLLCRHLTVCRPGRGLFHDQSKPARPAVLEPGRGGSLQKRAGCLVQGQAILLGA